MHCTLLQLEFNTTSIIAAIGPMATLNAVMAANPIGVVIIAIGALVTAGIALYQNWETVAKKLADIFKFITDGIDNLFGADEPVQVQVSRRHERSVASRGQRVPGVQSSAVQSVGNETSKSAIGGYSSANATGARSKIHGFATGTFSAPSGLAVVGETGPEVVNFGGGERVYTNSQSGRIQDSLPTDINININVQGTGVTDESLEQIKDVTRDVIDDYFTEMATKGGYKLGSAS